MSTTKDIMASTKTILITSENWEEWNNRFISQAIMCNLLPHIQGKQKLLVPPLEPVMADYSQKNRQSATRSRAQTIHESEDQGASEDQPAPEPAADHREITFSDLTAEGQKSFSMAWTFYQDKIKAFEKQQDLIRKLKEWIAANVSSHYQQTCCKPAE